MPLMMTASSLPMLLGGIGASGASRARVIVGAVIALTIVAIVASMALCAIRSRRGSKPRVEPCPVGRLGVAGLVWHDPASLALAAARQHSPSAGVHHDAGGPRGAEGSVGQLDLGAGRAPVRLPERPTSIALVGEAEHVGFLARWTRSQLAAQPLWASRVEITTAATWHSVPTSADHVINVSSDHHRAVTESWAEAVTTALDAPGTQALPACAPLDRLPVPVTASSVMAAWREHHPGLAAPLGTALTGPAWLDLAAAGPHALVAGTTGSGKSELLLAWALGLSARHAPSDLNLVLIDYKGGATFAPIVDLPHVVGVLTDLDASATGRALASLRAELRRREHCLASEGAKSLEQWREAIAARGAPDTADGSRDVPRLVVVVDEFRALAEEHPQFLDGLVRLAAQGRSLGIHLVLATQRPGGAVGPDVKANVTVRVCLRVLEEADSMDVIGSTAAARLPPRPGRALLRTDTTREFQAGLAGPSRPGEGGVADAVREAAQLARGESPSLLRTSRPWADPLPARVLVTDAPLGAIARVDLPAEQRLDWWAHEPGTVLVTGPPRSGRTAALRAILHAALETDCAAHVIAADPLALTAACGGHPLLGTVVGFDDPRRMARLVTLLSEPGAPGERSRRSLLVVDDAEPAFDALDLAAGPGGGEELIKGMLRLASSLRLDLAVSAGAAGSRLAPLTQRRVPLMVRDVGEASVLGIPRELVCETAPPGRGVITGAGPARLVQIAAPGHAPRRSGCDAATDVGDPIRLRPLPLLVSTSDLRAGMAGRSGAMPGGAGPTDSGAVAIALGIGGDHAQVLSIELVPGRPLLVLGSPGSGRSTVLDLIASQAPGRVRRVSGREGAPTRRTNPSDTATVLVDDAEWLSAEDSSALASLAASTSHRLVVVAGHEALATAYHGLLGAMRQARSALALGGAAGIAIAGHDTRRARDPLRWRAAGRGVLVHRGRVEPIQIAGAGALTSRSRP